MARANLGFLNEFTVACWSSCNNRNSESRYAFDSGSLRRRSHATMEFCIRCSMVGALVFVTEVVDAVRPFLQPWTPMENEASSSRKANRFHSVFIAHLNQDPCPGEQLRRP